MVVIPHITHPQVHTYLESVRPPSDPILREMEQLAKSRSFPAFGAQCSRILYALVRMIDARRVFELGSGFGYTMYWMASAMTEGGLVIGTEGDEKNAGQAREFFTRGRLDGRTDIRVGDALTLFEKERGPFDLIFCDIEKDRYIDAFEMAVPRLRKGGVFVADNLLYDGHVAEPDNHEAKSEAMRAFTRHIYSHPLFFTFVIPIRDGVSVSVKTGD
jgi:predicted O-methyltransferase YrrM